MSRGKRRVARRARRRPARRAVPTLKGVTFWEVLGKLLAAPTRYDENEAAMDSLAGRVPCQHGQWPHQGAFCLLCAGSAVTTVWKSLKPGTLDAILRDPRS